jgi:hypothetical protein
MMSGLAWRMLDADLIQQNTKFITSRLNQSATLAAALSAKDQLVWQRTGHLNIRQTSQKGSRTQITE